MVPYWCLALGAAALPSILTAVIHGWDPLRLLAVLLATRQLPLVPVAVFTLALAGTGLSLWQAARANNTIGPWLPGSILAGLTLLAAARSLPVHIVPDGIVANDDRPLAGAVVLLRLTGLDAVIEVLAGNGAYRRGEILRIQDADPSSVL